MAIPAIVRPTPQQLRDVLQREHLEGASPRILMACLMEACRCLGVAQALKDQGAMEGWTLRSEAYRLGLEEAVARLAGPGQAQAATCTSAAGHPKP